jgi:hypothetical protein
MQASLKSFGYGIYLVELVPPPAEKARPNGKKDVQQTEIYRSLRRSGLPFTEVVLDVEDEARAFVMASEGHEPTKFELSLITPGDWELIRTSIDMWGSQNFSNRLTMLEAHKPASERSTQPSP